MNRRPDPQSIRWMIASTTTPELVALILSVVVVLIAAFVLQAA